MGLRTPTHPGEVLKFEFLQEHGITAEELSDHIKYPLFLIKGVIEGTHRMTAELAARVAVAFNTSVSFWTNMQARVDEHKAQKMDTKGIKPLPCVTSKEAAEDSGLLGALDDLDLDQRINDLFKEVVPHTYSTEKWTIAEEVKPWDDLLVPKHKQWDDSKDVPMYDPSPPQYLGGGNRASRDSSIDYGRYNTSCTATSENPKFSVHQNIGIGVISYDKTDA